MHSTKRAVLNILLGLPFLVTAMVAGATYNKWGEWLGRLWPVTSPAKVISVKPVPGGGKGSGGWVELTIELTKYKSDYRECKWRSLRIYWKDADGALVRVPWKNPPEARQTEQNRPQGKNRITILVGSTLDVAKLHMDAYHDCFPFLPNFRTVLLPASARKAIPVSYAAPEPSPVVEAHNPCEDSTCLALESGRETDLKPVTKTFKPFSTKPLRSMTSLSFAGIGTNETRTKPSQQGQAKSDTPTRSITATHQKRSTSHLGLSTGKTL